MNRSAALAPTTIDPPPKVTTSAVPTEVASLTAAPVESLAVIVMVAISPIAYEALSVETVYVSTPPAHVAAKVVEILAPVTA